MEETVMRQHIDLYVNNFSVDLGEAGKKAVNEFLKIYARNNQASSIKQDVFI
jgi:1,4-dihydroxy-6-naphthoate synthase